MPVIVRIFATVALLFGTALLPAAAVAQSGGAVRVTSGVQYEFLARWDVAAR
jgi:hypothetical protein